MTLDLPAADASVWQRAAAFALAPLYGTVHIVLLVPIRWWALLTIRSGSWGTRTQVEAAAITVRSSRLIDTSTADRQSRVSDAWNITVETAVPDRQEKSYS